MPQPPANPPPPDDSWANKLATLEPVPTLLARLRQDLGAEFQFDRPMRLSRAPGRLDVMGGIADYTGSMVCEATLDRAAAVAVQKRQDRNVQVFSFNLLDANQPFTFRIPIDALAENSIEQLHREFNQEGRRWAGYLAGCLAILHHDGLIDLKAPAVAGMNIALYSTVPLGAGVSSSAAIEVATMINLMDELNIPRRDPMALAAMCQKVENQVVGAPCGIMDQVSSCAGQARTLLRMICQPHELQPPLVMPSGIRAMGINSNIRHSVGGGMYGRTRCAAFMAHKIILEKMRLFGEKAGRQLVADPMRGCLANLQTEDYKRMFRPELPEEIAGDKFLERYGPTIDAATRVDPAVSYRVRQVADHHVLEAQRVRNFATFLEEAGKLPADSRERGLLLDKAGHLMYGSHVSYTNNALLGADECDLLVSLLRKREPAGIYGAKITGGGSGGTVAVLVDQSPRADAAIADVMKEYQTQTGRVPEALARDGPGAWQVGTSLA